jgi:hypothetical protein
MSDELAQIMARIARLETLVYTAMRIMSSHSGDIEETLTELEQAAGPLDDMARAAPPLTPGDAPEGATLPRVCAQ